jgi:hypothetical protein
LLEIINKQCLNLANQTNVPTGTYQANETVAASSFPFLSSHWKILYSPTAGMGCSGSIFRRVPLNSTCGTRSTSYSWGLHNDSNMRRQPLDLPERTVRRANHFPQQGPPVSRWTQLAKDIPKPCVGMATHYTDYKYASCIEEKPRNRWAEGVRQEHISGP